MANQHTDHHHQPQPQQHFLIVTLTAQGQINPARHLARRLTRLAGGGARVTLAIPLSSHRRLFPSSSAADDDDGHHVIDDQPLVSYAAYSDGFDQGIDLGLGANINGDHFMSRLNLVGSQTLVHLALSLAARGRPVTCVLYSIQLAWVADVARDVLCVPSVLYWIQPAALLAIYYHYFHGYADVISTHKNDPSYPLNLPGLPLQLQIKDLPSALTDSCNPYLSSYGDIIEALKKESRPRVLINTFHALEADTIEANIGGFSLIPVGPVTEEEEEEEEDADLYERDKRGYLEWLDAQEERSVVYISFGSVCKMSGVQMKEIREGLKESGRPSLWVVRRDMMMIEEQHDDELSKLGMVVEWCNQLRVLSHRSVGCFVTHGGWNSTIESIVCGVPMVVVPQRADQRTNAKMVEAKWGNGVIGITEGRELNKCLDVVMGELGVEIRNKANMWKLKASEATLGEYAPSVQSLKAFVDDMYRA